MTTQKRLLLGVLALVVVSGCSGTVGAPVPASAVPNGWVLDQRPNWMSFVQPNGTFVTAETGQVGAIATKTGSNFTAAVGQSPLKPLVVTRTVDGNFVQDTYQPSTMQVWNDQLSQWRTTSQTAWDATQGTCQLVLSDPWDQSKPGFVTATFDDGPPGTLSGHAFCRQFAELWPAKGAWMTTSSPPKFSSQCGLTVLGRHVDVTDLDQPEGGSDAGRYACAWLPHFNDGTERTVAHQ